MYYLCTIEKDKNGNGFRWVVLKRMKNFAAEYKRLVEKVINEVISILEDNKLTGITLFSGHPYDAINKGKKLPLFETYWVCDEQEYKYIQKLVKCDDKWGFVLYDTNEAQTEFPRELNARDIDFECANNIYTIVYKMVCFKKEQMRGGDIDALKILREKLNADK